MDDVTKDLNILGLTKTEKEQIRNGVVLVTLFAAAAYFGAKRGAYKGAAKMLDGLKLDVNLATEDGLINLTQIVADPFPR